MRLIDNLKQRLFRWQSDGNAPLRLTQRRIFVLPNDQILVIGGRTRAVAK